MARIIRVLLVMTGMLAAAPVLGERVLPADVPHPNAVKAYRQYWEAFDQYESSLAKTGRKNFETQWENLKGKYRKEVAKFSAAKLARLEKAAKEYRRHLEEHPEADNRAFVMMNLAQINFMLGEQLALEDESAGGFAKEEALQILKDVEAKYPGFAYRDQALYLRAVILDSQKKPEAALKAWQTLAAKTQNTLHGVYAAVAVGDHMFAKEKPAEAMQAYKRALDILGKVEVEDRAFENLRINYRLAWAAYRSAELDVAVTAAVQLMRHDLSLKSEAERAQIQQDAAEIVGDAMYEANDMAKTKTLLKRADLVAFAPTIGLRAVARYNGSGIYGEASQLGEFLAVEFPLARETPEILRLGAEAFGNAKKDGKRVAMLERLAMLLPRGSLWRARYRRFPDLVLRMEEKAKPAAVAAAAWHYERGLASGSRTSLEAAAMQYEMLEEFAPNDQDANLWRLRIGHCRYFQGESEDAAKVYEAIKSEYKVDADTLQIAAYQLVLANERSWRKSFGKASETGQSPQNDAAVVAKARKLDKSVDEFVARFPGQDRSVDLLLVAASANRDMENFDKAASYWQRVLVSEPSPAQRATAIRGLVFATMKQGSQAELVDLVRRFLKLEDWQTLGINVGNELNGVLSRAALDEGKRLSDNGKVLEGGYLLTALANEFKNLPDRDRIFRDGGYMLAIGGDWAASQKAAEDYLDSGLKKNRADMVYLLGRSHEYQIRLGEAAKAYYELGTSYPTHARAMTSLERAYKLALAEDNAKLASAATIAMAAREKDPRLAHKMYQDGVDALAEGGERAAALEAARAQLRAAKTAEARYAAQLNMIQLRMQGDEEQAALDELVLLLRGIDRNRENLGDAYPALAGQAHFLMGDEAKRRFDDFQLADREGALSDKINLKLKYFEDLVANYDKAAAAGDPRYAAKARHNLAVAAQGFAEEIAAVPNRSTDGQSFKAKHRYKQTIDRLMAMSRRYHSANALAARKDQKAYKGNEWVQKSMLKIAGEKSDLPETKRQDQMPLSTPEVLPAQWSL